MQLLRDTLGKAADDVVEPTSEQHARMGLLDTGGTSGNFIDSIYQKGTANPAAVWWMIARGEASLAA